MRTDDSSPLKTSVRHAIMPALQRATPAALTGAGLEFSSASLPKQLRETRVVKDLSAEEVAQEIAAWIKG